jgi:UDP-N-acetylmuramoyl-tripeptide--D-alanyl-D-alanine ligase
MTLKEVLEHVPHSGFTGDENRKVARFTTDSRKAGKDDLFIALDGARSRGLDFIEDIIRKKCSAICADRKYSQELTKVSGRLNVILVEDAFSALRDMASFQRSLFKGHVVAVTGSNGKTTTKELIAGLLSLKYCVHKNEKNFNNEIGVPLTLFGLKPDHEILVTECGINHPGEMMKLAKMVRPEISVITNIGSAHLEFMGSEENIAREKAKLCDMTSGMVFVGLDNPYRNYFSREGLKIVTVHPEDKLADFHFDSVSSRGLDGWSVRYQDVDIRFPLYGRYNLENLAMAVAVANGLGIPALSMRKPLGKNSFDMTGRSSIFSNRTLTLIDESYNSNYSSLSASLENFRSLPDFETKFAVIGSMKELGQQSEELHCRIGTQLSGMELSGIFFTGDETESALRAYTGKASARRFDPNTDELFHSLYDALRSVSGRAAVLVKGSRANKLDELVEKTVAKFRLKSRAPGTGGRKGGKN